MFTKEWYKFNKHPRGMLGKKHTKKTKGEISRIGKGRIVTDEVKNKIALSKKGDKNPMWVGDSVKYHALHAWVRRNKVKPSCCEICKQEVPLDLANISQEYKRDLTDWEWLCRKCHMFKDGRLSRRINGKFRKVGY